MRSVSIAAPPAPVPVPPLPPLSAAVASILVNLRDMPGDELLEHLARLSASLNAVAAEVTARVRRLELETRDAALAARLAESLSIGDAARELGVCRETAARWSSAKGGNLVHLNMHRKAPRGAWEEAYRKMRTNRRWPGRRRQGAVDAT